MASSTPHTIIREWPGHDGPKFQEALAFAAIKPGELVYKNTAGKLILNADAGGTIPIPKMVAVESPWAATSGSTNAIDTDYASGDTVRYVEPPTGAVLYMDLADGTTAVIGSRLTSNGAGALQLAVDANLVDDGLVGYATEAVTASGATARCHVRIA